MNPARSLTTRLALAFALIAGCAFAGVGVYLYSALAMQITDRDDSEILHKAVRARTELADDDSSAPERWREMARVVSGNEEFGIRVLGPDGTLLLSAGATAMPMPEGMAVAADDAVGADAIRTWHTLNGTKVRGVSMLARLEHGPAQVKVELFQVGASRVALLRAYRWKIFFAVFLGAVGAGVLGFVALHAGMAPLRRIAASTKKVTFSREPLPIDPSALPAELKELAQALQQMIDRLRERYERLSQFSADLAHDFRTPIGNLLGQTQVALSSERSVEEYQALLASNVEEYERLARMIENMLFLARADNARVGLNYAELDLAEELVRQADYFELLADARQITIRVDASGKVKADAILLRRAMGNLIANAVRYSPPGAQIRLSGRELDGEARIEVSNPGSGIAAEDLPRLFDRFFRGDPARANSGESSGIGLAIVKTIMDLHRGTVEAESTPGGKTSFRLVFPARPASR